MRQTTMAPNSALPAPRATSRWRWATTGRTVIGGSVLAAVLALGTGAASAATTHPATGSSHPGAPGGPGGGPFGNFQATTWAGSPPSPARRSP